MCLGESRWWVGARAGAGAGRGVRVWKYLVKECDALERGRGGRGAWGEGASWLPSLSRIGLTRLAVSSIVMKIPDARSDNLNQPHTSQRGSQPLARPASQAGSQPFNPVGSRSR